MIVKVVDCQMNVQENQMMCYVTRITNLLEQKWATESKEWKNDEESWNMKTNGKQV